MPENAAHGRSGNGRGLLVSILVLIVLAPLGYYVVRGTAVALGGKPSVEFLERPATQDDRCIWNMEAGEMRLHHWEHLARIREDVVRFGKRDVPGLNECRNCHQSRANFCDRCHNQVSLTPDCFGCHYYPDNEHWDPQRFPER
ncbi:MAG TPA: hypothetical protein VMY42_26165 [Thermoguttaceae bacterium]|nr:hypothetical protein [Thermoguttaceae bacterium]